MTGTPATKQDKLFGAPRGVVEREFRERERVQCPICHLDPEAFAVDPQGLFLARCPRCELEFQSPRPTLKSLTQKVYGRDYHASDHADPDSPRQRAQWTRQMRGIVKLHPRKGKLLDVGCGAGGFLNHAREQGWQVAGTDIVVDEAVRALGVPVHIGRLREIGFGSEKFDAIRYNHVLEHVEDPLAELQQARNILQGDGVLFLSVPNLSGLSAGWKSFQSRARLKRNPWRHYAALHHLWFFTPATLRKLAEEAGFVVEHWETPVLPSAKRTAVSTYLLAVALEWPRWASILDFYCRPR